MDKYIPRQAERKVLELASFFPVVAVVGPRQVGKTSLTQAIRNQLDRPSIYLDLENPEDRNKLENAGLFLSAYKEQTVILDEVQRVPALFPLLRSLVDQHRVPARFILLGSASPDLIRDSSESLAGRIAYYELTPFRFEEVSFMTDYRTHWYRGGFPDALLAPTDDLVRLWRQNFIATYLERDLPLLGLSADPILTGRLWQMTAHLSGQLLNMETLAGSLGINGNTVKRYLNYLEAAYLIRRLPPYYANLKKRLVKTPKLYLRDTGILHQLLGIGSFLELSGHPSLGASWETYIIEQIAAILPDWADLYFYRTHTGTEADLVITKGGKPEILLEIKYSSTPKAGKGFYIAQEDLATRRHYIVSPVEESYPLSETVQVLSYRDIERIFEPS